MEDNGKRHTVGQIHPAVTHGKIHYGVALKATAIQSKAEHFFLKKVTFAFSSDSSYSLLIYYISIPPSRAQWASQGS